MLVPETARINFDKPGTAGQLSATSPLFDGIQCPDPRKNQFLLKGKPASVKLSLLQPRTNEFTVEFWFRFPKDAKDLPSPNYLFTMAVQNNGVAKEAMTVFIDTDGLLKCAPFGVDSSRETILVYGNVRPTEIDAWQHVSCIYDRDSAITGQHLAFNTDSVTGLDMTKAVKQGLLAKTYAVSLASKSDRILNYIQATKMDVVLGSNPVGS